MSVVNRAHIWLWRQQPRRRRREQVLRDSYQELLHEGSRTLEERVQFHFDHLEEYWDRCLGFLDLVPDHRPTFVVGDLAVCIYVSSAAAAADVRHYCVAHGSLALNAAWEQYERSLRDMGRAYPSVATAVRQSADKFRRARDAHGQLRA